MKANDIRSQVAAMKPGKVRHVNGHRVERVAAGWIIDERFASSPRQIAACLSQATPCQREHVTIADSDFDNP